MNRTLVAFLIIMAIIVIMIFVHPILGFLAIFAGGYLFEEGFAKKE